MWFIQNKSFLIIWNTPIFLDSTSVYTENHFVLPIGNHNYRTIKYLLYIKLHPGLMAHCPQYLDQITFNALQCTTPNEYTIGFIQLSLVQLYNRVTDKRRDIIGKQTTTTSMQIVRIRYFPICAAPFGRCLFISGQCSVKCIWSRLYTTTQSTITAQYTKHQSSNSSNISNGIKMSQFMWS